MQGFYMRNRNDALGQIPYSVLQPPCNNEFRHKFLKFSHWIRKLIVGHLESLGSYL